MIEVEKNSARPKCSIVIRAFNEEEHIGRLLEGIMAQSMKSWEIILVDSGSTDATRAIASRYPTRIVDISPDEFTFGRSLNLGIEHACGEIIVIISAHCYPVYPDWLELMAAPFSDPCVGVTYGKQRGGESNHYSELQFFQRYFPNNSQPKQGQPYTHNANAAIRRSLWEQHPYDESLTGLEDIAWSSWVSEEGYEISYVAEAEIIHAHDETFAQVYNRYRREAVALKQILPQSHFTLRNFLSMWARKSAADLSQAYKDKKLFSEWADILLFRFLQYLGTWRGYRYSGKVDSQLHKQFYYPPHILSEKVSTARAVEPIEYESTSGKEKHPYD